MTTSKLMYRHTFGDIHVTVLHCNLLKFYEPLVIVANLLVSKLLQHKQLHNNMQAKHHDLTLYTVQEPVSLQL